MKTGKKILYFLFIVFVFLNIVLFLKLRLLLTSPTIEIINHERRSKYFTSTLSRLIFQFGRI
jgi:hypothetical protein